MKILVVGYGNESRSEDGVGIYVARQIAKRNLPEVEVMTCQQLHVDRVEDFLGYDRVILVDAAVEGAEVAIRKVEEENENKLDSSHYLGPEMLVGLAKKLYGKPLPLFVCSLRASRFEFGFEFSEAVKKAAEEAEAKIVEFIEKETSHA